MENLRGKIIGAGLAVAIGFSAACGNGSENPNTPDESSSIEDSSPTDYTSSLGFSIRMPADWKAETRITSGNAPIEEFILNRDTNVPSLRISYQTLDEPRSIEQIREDQFALFNNDTLQDGSPFFTKVSKEDCEKIDGQECLAISATDIYNNSLYITLFENEDKSEIWSAAYFSISRDYDTNIDSVKHALNSIKLTKHPITPSPNRILNHDSTT